MKRPKSMAAAMRAIDELEQKLEQANKNVQAWEKTCKDAREQRDRNKNEIETLKEEIVRVQRLAEQMRGFIRAKHAEMVPTGRTESGYVDGIWQERPAMTEVYPFMDAEF